MVEIDRNSKMWELLNVVPLIELNKLSPEESAKVHRRSEERISQEQRFQNSLGKPVSEFFGESTENSSE